MNLINPQYLISLLFIIPVLFLFFYKNIITAFKIDSLFFYKKLFKKKRFYQSGVFLKKNYFLLFTHILIILSLALAMGGLFFERDKNKTNTVILLDTSASMNIKYKGKSRLFYACEEAGKWINTACNDKKIALAVINKKLKIVTPFLADRDILKKFLNEIKPTDTAGKIFDEHIKLIEKSYPDFSQIIVFTDTLPDIPEKENLAYKIFNGSDGNIAITSLKITDNQAGQSILTLKIRCDNVKPFYIPLVINNNHNILIEKELSLNAAETAEINISLRTKDWHDDIGSVKIDIKDAYDADNIAYFKLNSKSYVKIQGKSDSVLRAVKANSDVSLSKTSDTHKNDITVTINQPGGGDLLDKNLVINPVTGEKSLFVGEKVFLNKSIKTIYPDHPIMKNIVLGRFVIAYCYRMKMPDDAVVLAEAGNIPVIFCRRSAGSKYVVVNFPVDETVFINQISFPIFIANSLSWLQGNHSGIHITGDFFAADFLENGGVTLNHAGIYNFTDKNKKNHRLYVHLLSDDESICSQPERSYRKTQAIENIYLKKFFIIFALILLICESIFFYGLKIRRPVK
ncbi:hypothetical protein J7L67_10360 [bacterium]|nr:hypothetical protein [bacterium]